MLIFLQNKKNYKKSCRFVNNYMSNKSDKTHKIKNILFLETSPEKDKKSAHTISVEEKKKEFKDRDFRIVSIKRNDSFSYEEEHNGNEIIYKMPSIDVPIIRMILFNHFLFVKLIMLNIKVDLVYVHVSFDSIPIFFYKLLKNNDCLIQYDVLGLRFIRLKLLDSISSYDQLHIGISYYMNLVMFNCADFFTTINQKYKKIISRYTDKNVYVVRTAIDGSFFEEIQNNRFKEKLGIEDKKILMFIGNFYQKRLEDFFDIVVDLLRDRGDFVVVIIGFGNYYEHYVNRAKENNLYNKRIFFLGYKPHEDIPSYLLNADICYTGSFIGTVSPKKIYEYLGMGCATIVKDTKPNREVFKEGKHLLYYDDDKELKEKLLYLLENKEERDRLGRNGKKYVLDNHLWKNRVDKLINIYENELMKKVR